MKFASELLPQLWWTPLRGLEKAAKGNCKDWLSTGHYFVDRCSSSGFEITLHSDSVWAGPIAYEINAWTTAAFETMFSIADKGSQPRACAWMFIQSYYGAYFAAHSLLRFFGCAFTHLESIHANSVYKAAIASGVVGSKTPSTGDYEIWLEPSTRRIIATQKGSSHSDFWASFSKLLEEIKGRISGLAGVKEVKEDSEEFIKQIRNFLKGGGSLSNGGWLSVQRNNINYRKGLGLWYPYSKSSPYFDDVAVKMRKWQLPDPLYSVNASDADTAKMIELTNVIIGLSKIFVNEMDSKRSSKKNFIDDGALKYMRQLSK